VPLYLKQHLKNGYTGAIAEFFRKVILTFFTKIRNTRSAYLLLCREKVKIC